MGRLTPIAHWKLNDNAASTTVVDAMVSHNGTYTSVGGDANTADHTSAGGITSCLDFVGDDDYIVVGDHADFTPALTPLSISAWVNMDDATSFTVASKGVYNTDGEWLLGTNGSDQLYVCMWDESEDNCINGKKFSTALTSYEGQWIHVGFSYNGGLTGDELWLYLNGEKVYADGYVSRLSSFEGVENLLHDVWIGRYGDDYSNGKIDNLMMFNHALDAAEMRRLYNSGHGTEIPAEGEEGIVRSSSKRDRYK